MIHPRTGRLCYLSLNFGTIHLFILLWVVHHLKPYMVMSLAWGLFLIWI
uniref:Uncharacterized protein n=1 Tax=Arundo donax TaxID=35708 RepID=A0A0A8Y8X8_ARUDO